MRGDYDRTAKLQGCELSVWIDIVNLKELTMEGFQDCYYSSHCRGSGRKRGGDHASESSARDRHGG